MPFNSAFQVNSYNDIYVPTGKTCTQTALDDPQNFKCQDGNDSMPNLCIQVQNDQPQTADFVDAGTTQIYQKTSVNYVGSSPNDR